MNSRAIPLAVSIFYAVTLPAVFLLSKLLNSGEINKSVSLANGFMIPVIIMAVAVLVTANNLRSPLSRYSLYVFLAITYYAAYVFAFYQTGTSGLIPDAKDTLYYHENALKLIDLGFFEGVGRFLSSASFDDLGTVVYVYFIYRIHPEPFLVYFFNVCVSLLAVKSYAYVAKSIFNLEDDAVAIFVTFVSPLLLAFAVTHFKEALLTLCFALFFCGYAKYREKQRFSSIFLMLLSVLGFLFLRTIMIPVVVAAFIAASLHEGVADGVRLKFKWSSLVYLVISLVALVITYDFVATYMFRFSSALNDGVTAAEIPLASTIATRVISVGLALIGPLSSFTSNVGSEIKGVAAPGVYLYALFVFPFLIGVHRLLKFGNHAQLIVTYFILIHALILGWIMRGFDPRFTLYQKPLYLMVAFIGMQYIRNLSESSRKVFLMLFGLSLISVFIASLIYQSV